MPHISTLISAHSDRDVAAIACASGLTGFISRRPQSSKVHYCDLRHEFLVSCSLASIAMATIVNSSVSSEDPV